MGEHPHRSLVTRKPSRTLPRIVSIGAGNVATHLTAALEGAGVGEVVQVYSRTEASARTLASRLWDAEAVTDTALIIPDADIYLVSLADHAVTEVLARLSPNNALWLHTSGSLPLDVLRPMSRKCGVFYPLQTFSKGVKPDIDRIPLFIEGSTPGVEAEIREMGEKVFKRVVHADSDLRRRMHVAAVFACNFTNYLWGVADDLLRADGLDLSVLHPLLDETLRKAETLEGGPAAGQTGPAVRGDMKVMAAHEASLPPELASIYRQLSEAIYNRHHPEK